MKPTAIKTSFVGTLAKDAEVKTYGESMQYISVSIYLSDTRKVSKEYVKVTTFITVSKFLKKDEDASKQMTYLKKGAIISVYGAVGYDIYQKGGENELALYITSEELRIIGFPPKQSDEAPKQQATVKNELPKGNIEEEDNDLPF